MYNVLLIYYIYIIYYYTVNIYIYISIQSLYRYYLVNFFMDFECVYNITNDIVLSYEY